MGYWSIGGVGICEYKFEMFRVCYLSVDGVGIWRDLFGWNVLEIGSLGTDGVGERICELIWNVGCEWGICPEMSLVGIVGCL